MYHERQMVCFKFTYKDKYVYNIMAYNFLEALHLCKWSLYDDNIVKNVNDVKDTDLKLNNVVGA